MAESYDTLVLSSGGISGFYLIGGLQAMIDMNLLSNVEKYIGTSVGAYVCYFLIIGYTPVEILGMINSNKWLEKLANVDILSVYDGNGALSFAPIAEFLETMTIKKIGKFLTLGKLKELYNKTLICTTYNMTTCSIEYLGPENYPDLPCLTALRMTSNIPLIFDRFQYMDNYYIDGAITQHFPILKGEEIGNKVLGLNLDFDEKSIKDEPEKGLINYIFKLLQIPMIENRSFILKNITDKSTIISIKTDKLIGSTVNFDIEHRARMDMFFNGYTFVNDYLKSKSTF